MAISAEVLRTHLDYSSWASQRLFTAAAELSEEELTRDFGTADRSILGTLTHVFLADKSWLARVSGGPRPDLQVRPGFAELQTQCADLDRQWAEWARSLTDQSGLNEISYQDWKNRHWKQPLWQLLLHIVNHATHHRGQIAGFLRSMGRVPPPLDFIFYLREKMPS